MAQHDPTPFSVTLAQIAASVAVAAFGVLGAWLNNRYKFFRWKHAEDFKEEKADSERELRLVENAIDTQRETYKHVIETYRNDIVQLRTDNARFLLRLDEERTRYEAALQKMRSQRDSYRQLARSAQWAVDRLHEVDENQHDLRVHIQRLKDQLRNAGMVPTNGRDPLEDDEDDVTLDENS